MKVRRLRWRVADRRQSRARRATPRSWNQIAGPALCTAAVLALAVQAAATTLYVGGGSQYESIGAALSVAADGDTILVCAGTYSGPDNTNLDFGGRNIVLRATAGPAQTFVECGGARALEFHSRERETSVVQGFTFRNGYADFGGAIYCVFSCPTISQCVFENCVAEYGGGALRYSETPSTHIVDCEFVGNAARHCGALSAFRTTIDASGCTFTNNIATEGGAISASDGTTLTLLGCEISANTALASGGAVCVSDTASLVLTDCNLLSNSAEGSGGAIYGIGAALSLSETSVSSNVAGLDGGGLRVQDGSLVISTSAIDHNTAGNAGGGAHLTDTADATIEDSQFIGNHAGSCGGIKIIAYGTRIADCLFQENTTSGSYATLFVISQNLVNDGVMERCTIIGNRADQTNAIGYIAHQTLDGCVFIQNSSRGNVLEIGWSTVTSCTFLLNESRTIYGGIVKDFGSDYDLFSNCIFAFSTGGSALAGAGDQEVSMCCIHGNDVAGSVAYTSVIDIDPLICDMEGGDARLCSNSPCLGGSPDNPWGVHIGALDEGCGDCGSPVETMSWGAIKGLYR